MRFNKVVQSTVFVRNKIDFSYILKTILYYLKVIKIMFLNSISRECASQEGICQFYLKYISILFTKVIG